MQLTVREGHSKNTCSCGRGMRPNLDWRTHLKILVFYFFKAEVAVSPDAPFLQGSLIPAIKQ